MKYHLNIKRNRSIGLVAAGCVGIAGMIWAEAVPVASDQARLWINHLLPLPHEISITNAVTIKPADMSFVSRPDAGSIRQQALADLQSLYRDKVGFVPTGTAFQVILEIVNDRDKAALVQAADAKRLADCPNKDQAYLIQPEGANRLIVAGLTEKGVYYGAQTLRQLLAVHLARESVTIPLVRVLDWPDMEERGVWNGEVKATPALAALKLNFQTYICGYKREQQTLRPELNRNILELLRNHAMVERVQMIHHLNYLGKYGLYQLYPELKGKGEKAVPEGELYKYGGRDIANICASNPLWVKIIADMLTALSSQGARDVSVWMSEFTGSCQCDECRKLTQVQLESKLIAAAWQQARRQYPDLALRIFFSQGDDKPATAQALADLPPEVKIERVYNMGKPFLDAAAQGRWVMTFDGKWMDFTDFRFWDPECYAKPIRKGHAEKLKGVLSLSAHYLGDGVVAPAYYPIVYNYALSAIAEWSWNINGRNTRQFQEAWATRQGYEQPAQFADWAEKMAALTALLTTGHAEATEGTNLKGFKNPFRLAGEKIRQRQPLGYYSTQELVRAQEYCQQALAVAEKLNKPEAAVETRFLMAFVQMHAKLNSLSERIMLFDASQPAGQKPVREALGALQAATENMLAAKDRQIGLWKAEPAAFAEKAKKEIHEQWENIQQSMEVSLKAVLNSEPSPARQGSK